MKDERDEMGATQAFEFCYELSWKMMKRVLGQRGIEVHSPKDAFRQAALIELIENPEVWFDFQKTRNLTVHTYNEETLDAVVSVFDPFSKELSLFIEQLRAYL